MHAISASRKTDIPAFYSRWFMNRVRAGFCHWIHPYDGRVYTLSLKPEDCAGIVFWTRYPLPMLPHLGELAGRGLPYYFIVTITGYPGPIERHVPSLDRAIAAFQALAERTSPGAVFWKYDPIILDEHTPPAAHAERFARIAGRLAGYTHRCLYSWLIPQPGTGARVPPAGERHALLKSLVQAAAANGIELYSCFSADYLAVPGVRAGRCVDVEVLRRRAGRPRLDLLSAADFGGLLRGPARSPQAVWHALLTRILAPLRPAPALGPCRCGAAVDVGCEETCLFGCTYCMATRDHDTARANHRAHDPEDSLLWRPPSLRGINLRAAPVFPYGLAGQKT